MNHDLTVGSVLAAYLELESEKCYGIDGISVNVGEKEVEYNYVDLSLGVIPPGSPPLARLQGTRGPTCYHHPDPSVASLVYATTKMRKMHTDPAEMTLYFHHARSIIPSKKNREAQRYPLATGTIVICLYTFSRDTSPRDKSTSQRQL